MRSSRIPPSRRSKRTIVAGGCHFPLGAARLACLSHPLSCVDSPRGARPAARFSQAWRCFALAVLIGAIAIGHGIRDRNTNDVVSVTGSAKQQVVSDYADLGSLGDEPAARRPPPPRRSSRGWAAQIRSFLTDEGIKRDELTVQPVVDRRP